MKEQQVRYLVQAAAIASIYVVLTLIFAPISYGEIQVRVSEGLTILPFFTPAAVPGLVVGCIVANILGGAVLADIIFGSLATLIGAFISYRLRYNKFLVPIPPILANTLIIPFVLKYGYGAALPVPLMMLTVFAGELISCGVIGLLLLHGLFPYRKTIFGSLAE